MHTFSHKFVPIKISCTCFEQIIVHHQEVISVHAAYSILSRIYGVSSGQTPHRCIYHQISAGAIEGHFEGRTPREGHQGGSCSCTTMPRLTGHLQPRRNWPAWASNVLITHPIFPDLAPSDYHLFPGLKKKTVERSPFFFRRGGHCCRGDLVGRTTF